MAISNREAGRCAGEGAKGARTKIDLKSFRQSHLDTIASNSHLTGTGGTTNMLALARRPSVGRFRFDLVGRSSASSSPNRRPILHLFSSSNGHGRRCFSGSARIGTVGSGPCALACPHRSWLGGDSARRGAERPPGLARVRNWCMRLESVTGSSNKAVLGGVPDVAPPMIKLGVGLRVCDPPIP
ncbi:hypothetical protein B296_00017206 [Ensete ventricosum]|uniref:Uncharacterized protein n=1 Tax=Ensete ventricosum TaxID=4639 RepID=A0A426ZJJ9_ENSVE|nr:hypothetical protein B296_00017206 [Ensete ventricosum]